MKNTMTELLAAKLIESTLVGRNAFMIFVDGIELEDCAKWEKGWAEFTALCTYDPSNPDPDQLIDATTQGLYFLIVLEEKEEGGKTTHKVNKAKGWSELKKEDKGWGNFGFRV